MIGQSSQNVKDLWPVQYDVEVFSRLYNKTECWLPRCPSWAAQHPTLSPTSKTRHQVVSNKWAYFVRIAISSIKILFTQTYESPVINRTYQQTIDSGSNHSKNIRFPQTDSHQTKSPGLEYPTIITGLFKMLSLKTFRLL